MVNGIATAILGANTRHAETRRQRSRRRLSDANRPGGFSSLLQIGLPYHTLMRFTLALNAVAQFSANFRK
jgi:hypothetical protein